MYAIIATGGKQYKVSEGDVIKVEKLEAECESTEITTEDVARVINVPIVATAENIPSIRSPVLYC